MKGLRRAIAEVYSERGVVQRCQVHKRCNVLAHLTSELDVGTLAPQPELSVWLVRKLIELALGEGESTSKPVPVSEWMKDHWLVRTLTHRLSDRLDFDLKPAVRGCLNANARGERGFSLRVFSPIPSWREVSVLHVRGGAEKVRFASRTHPERHVPDHPAEGIAAWCHPVQHICGENRYGGRDTGPDPRPAIGIGRARGGVCRMPCHPKPHGVRRSVPLAGNGGDAAPAAIAAPPNPYRSSRLGETVKRTPPIQDGFDEEAQRWSESARDFEVQSLPKRFRNWKRWGKTSL